MNAAKEKLIRLGEMFDEFPKLYWLSLFYMGIVFAIMITYEPIVVWAYKLELFNQNPFQLYIASNLQILRWGQLVLPLIVALLCWFSIASLYEEKYFRKYKRYPS